MEGGKKSIRRRSVGLVSIVVGLSQSVGSVPVREEEALLQTRLKVVYLDAEKRL